MKRTFSKPQHVLLAIIVTICIFCAEAWVPVLPLIMQILNATGWDAYTASIFATVLWHSFADLGSASLLYSLGTAVLTGINISLLVFYFRIRRVTISSFGTMSAVVGALLSIFGIGCATCGSVFLVALFGTTGATFIATLPFGGLGLGMLGALLFLLSTVLLVRAINRPAVCPI